MSEQSHGGMGNGSDTTETRDRSDSLNDWPLGLLDIMQSRRFVFDITDPNSDLIEVVEE